MPPSTTNTWPVTYDAPSEQRNATMRGARRPACRCGAWGCSFSARPSPDSFMLVGHRGLDKAGRDRVDADAPAGDLFCGGFRQPDDARLARGVVRLPRVSGEPTTDVMLTILPRFSRAMWLIASRVQKKQLSRFARNHLVVLLVRHAHEKPVAGDARVVDEHVESAERFHAALHQRRARARNRPDRRRARRLFGPSVRSSRQTSSAAARCCCSARRRRSRPWRAAGRSRVRCRRSRP